MEIVQYKIKDLINLIEKPGFLVQDDIPICTHRAVSQSKNPRANPDDLALIVAYDKKKVVSYIGMIPDLIYIEGKEQKIAWGSTGWVAEEYKKTGIYVVLLFQALEAYDNNFAIAEVSESARKVFESSRKFVQLKELHSKTVVSRVCSEQYLTNRNKKFKYIFPVLRFTDFLSNLVLHPFFSISMNSSGIEERIRHEKTKTIDEESLSLIRSKYPENIQKREKKELEWILNEPWVLQTDQPTREDNKYFFSVTSRKFVQEGIKLFKDDKLICFLIIKQRDNHISIPYSFFDKNEAQDVLQFIFHYLFKNKADKVTLFNNELIEQIKTVKANKLYIKSRKRKSYISKKYKGVNFADSHLHPGDGDNVFT